MANTRFFTKNVGSPWEIFSITSGNSRQILRTRLSCRANGFAFILFRGLSSS